MFTRPIARLLVRAVLTAGLLLGVVSYGHYLSGGDPGALWKKVAGNALGGAADAFGGMRDAAGAPLGSAAAAFGGGDDGSRRRGVGDRTGDDVWTWRDENGVTHYATARPTDIEARVVTVDPDTNVLAPFTATPSRAGRSDAPAPDAATAEAMLRMLQPPSR